MFITPDDNILEVFEQACFGQGDIDLDMIRQVLQYGVVVKLPEKSYHPVPAFHNPERLQRSERLPNGCSADAQLLFQLLLRGQRVACFEP